MMPELPAPGSKVMKLAAELEAAALRMAPPVIARDPLFLVALRRECLERARARVWEPVQ